MRNRNVQLVFEIFGCCWQLWQNSKGKKAFLRGNLNCYILETKGRRKLKFGEVSSQICQKFLRKNQAKIFST